MVIIAIILVLCYFIVALTKNEKLKLISVALWIFITLGLFITVLTLNEEMKYYRELRGRCPEYEKVENVYKLKEK